VWLQGGLGPILGKGRQQEDLARYSLKKEKKGPGGPDDAWTRKENRIMSRGGGGGKIERGPVKEVFEGNC